MPRAGHSHTSAVWLPVPGLWKDVREERSVVGMAQGCCRHHGDPDKGIWEKRFVSNPHEDIRKMGTRL